MRKTTTLLFSLLYLCSLSAQQPLTELPATAKRATVYKVHDGDSYFLIDSTRRNAAGKYHRFDVRLQKVDAPEVYAKGYSIDQDYGRIAGDSMRAYLKGRVVWYDSTGTDFYGNMLAAVYVVDSTDFITDVSAYAVANGYAWAWVPTRKSKRTDYDRFLLTLQEVAQDENRGLWGIEGKKIRPANWRRMKTGGK
jgi:endonuclease YncB( thermonuclease family)